MSAGLTNQSRASALATLLPNGTDVDIALFTGMPAGDGSGYVEVSGGTWYARQTLSGWVAESDGDTAKRVNTSTVDFGTVDFPATGVVGFGIFADGTNDLIAFGDLLNNAGALVPIDLAIGDQVQLQEGQITVAIGDAGITLSGIVGAVQFRYLAFDHTAFANTTPLDEPLPTGAIVIRRRVVVIAPFDGSSQTITIGVSGDDSVMPASDNDPAVAGVYSGDVEIDKSGAQLTLTATNDVSPTTGNGEAIVEFIVPS